MTYQTYTPISGTRSISTPALGVPPGTAVEPQVAELLRDIALQLGLPDAGVVTPWATRVGDMSWQEIQNPDTNIATFELTDNKIQEATAALFGQPLPFITVMTGELQTIAELKRILEDSNYELFETQGVYRQDDSEPIPTIQFLHWLRVKDLADQSDRGSKSMGQVAREMHGLLRFSQQVPVEGTSLRDPPGISFEDAFDLQEPAPIDVIPGPPGAPPRSPGIPQPSPPVTEPVPGAPPQRGSIFGPLLVGVGVLAATVVIGNAARKKK